ncbi:MAG: hypothetical protein QOE92_645 [Chloroflexota bacterium]|nr:hypothetical protein [Chloroflexota bacterium]
MIERAGHLGGPILAWKRWLAAGCSLAVLLSALTLVTAPVALAYEGCNSEATGTVDPTVVDGGGTAVFDVTIRDCNGNGIEGDTVVFSQGTGPANCQATFNPPSARTDANGHVSTVVTFPPGCPCQYELRATDTTRNVTVTTTVRENGCLPFTGAAPPVAESPIALPLASVGTLLVALGAGLWMFRRRREEQAPA